MNTAIVLMTLNVPVGLEDAMVDFLLTFESEQGFSSLPVNAHHHSSEGLSLAEQVSGRQKEIRFQMYVEQQNMAVLLSQLQAEFSGAGIRYWVMPVMACGVV